MVKLLYRIERRSMNATAAVEEIGVGEIVIRWLVEGSTTGGTLAMFEFEVPPGPQAPPAHSHDSWDETVYGIRGTLTWTVDGVPTTLCAGDVLHIPSEVVHRFENVSSEPALQLAVITPGVLGPGYFR